MTLYRIVYNDGFVGPARSWPATLVMLRAALQPGSLFADVGIRPVRVEFAC